MEFPKLEVATLKSQQEGWVVNGEIATSSVPGGFIPHGALVTKKALAGSGVQWTVQAATRWSPVDEEAEGWDHVRPIEWLPHMGDISDSVWKVFQAQAEVSEADQTLLASQRVEDIGDVVSVVLVEADIPELGLRRGDQIHRARTADKMPTGHRRPIMLDQMEALRAAMLDGKMVRHLTPWITHNYPSVPINITDRRKWGTRKKVWSPTLLVTRDFDTVVSEPVQAESDEAAVFELIASCGGRLVTPGSARGGHHGGR